MSQLSVACLLIVVALASADSVDLKCPANSEPKQCGSMCESTCRKPEKVYCNPKDPDSCKLECRCLDDLVRNEESNECVKISECPRSSTTTEPSTPTTETSTTTAEQTTKESRCPANEVLSICGRMCEPTCSNKKPNTLFCPRLQCSRFTETCRCKNGTYRNDNGDCVLEKDCPDDSSEKKCGDNEELGGCGKYCEGTCDEPNNTKCNLILCFTQDCRCKVGYVRGKDDKCVPKGECPKKDTGCNTGEIMGCRGKSCEATCDRTSRPLRCALLPCGTKGCQCDLNNGYVRDKASGKCVLKKDCPKDKDD